MTSQANPFVEGYGYQFQDGDQWVDRSEHVLSDYWMALAEDGSRRIVDWENVGFRLGRTGQLLYDRHPRLPIYYGQVPVGSRLGSFLGYDWISTPYIINQVPYLQTYQRNAAVSAHDLQVTLGTDVMQSAEANDYNTVKNTFIHLIGAAWQRYVEWAAVDPEELIVGGNFDGTPLWSRNLDDHAATDEALCGTCDIANFARRFYFHANLPLFRRLHRSGIIYSVDRSANPWESTIFAVASQPESQYYDDLDTAYHEALRYYDENVGARLHDA